MSAIQEIPSMLCKNMYSSQNLYLIVYDVVTLKKIYKQRGVKDKRCLFIKVIHKTPLSSVKYVFLASLYYLLFKGRYYALLVKILKSIQMSHKPKLTL